MPRKKSSKAPPAAKTDPVLPGVNPAADHDEPERSLPFPIVAAGASAGGLEALGRLLGELKVDAGMAYVLVQHLSPKHESMLAEILGRTTKLPVVEAGNNMPVERDHVYVMPPGKNMVISHGLLQLGPRTELGGQHRPIDHFMRALAEEQGHKAIGVVLSGTGNDGSLGINEIKAAGGITFAQDTTAEQGSMPRSAIATGAVDFVLPPEEIARELGRISQHPLARSDGEVPAEGMAFVKILEILRDVTGVDFANYKRNTLQRRIARRVILHKLDSMEAYLEMLKANEGEVRALYDDVLISVTSFFRNADAYEALKREVFPKLTQSRGRHEQVRVWALGCATGEEAYSLAMTYLEFAEASGQRIPMQVFATDLNAVGIERARTGIYPRGITQDVSPERLRRFFVEIDGQYRIAKPIRDMCVFARQNVLADPPFSRLDLIACRNMLIYLQPVLQQKLIPLLHYALRPEGVLWLGSSETIGSFRDLFDLVDSRHKIYAKKGGARTVLDAPITAPRWLGHAVPERMMAAATATTLPPDPQREADRMLLTRYAPPSVVVNSDLEIMQFRGDTSPFLTPAPGRASLNLLKMLREGLAVAVRGAVHRAKREGAPAMESGLRVKTQGRWREVDVVATPLKDGGLLVTFEEPAKHVAARARQLDAEARVSQEKADRAVASRAPHEAAEREVHRLQQELSAMRDYLTALVEQHESANEELQAANEEVQSANEELQSVNEELETSKEELQSSNEELATVNQELQNRNVELSRSNSDFANLLSSVQIAIVIVGQDLRVRRFTAAAERLLGLEAGDLERPLDHVKLGLTVPNLQSILLDVMHNIASSEVDVQDRTGRWYSLRVRPYRSADNTLDGAVLAFVDVDAHKRAQLAIRESEERFELLAESAPVLIWMSDLEGVRFTNRAFEEFVGETEHAIRGADIAHFVHPDDQVAFAAGRARALAEHGRFEARCRVQRADGVFRWMQVTAIPRILGDGQMVGYVGSMVDVTDMKEAHEALMELDRGKNEFLAMLAHELRNPLSGIRNATRLLDPTVDEDTRAQAHAIIERQGEHMTRMVDDLLDVARVTSGRIQLRTETFDLVAVIRQAIDLTMPERTAAGQKLVFEAPKAAAWMHGDAMRLGQVFSNLLNNASKFSRRGGTVTVTVEVAAGEAGTLAPATIRVRDDGVGIDSRMLHRIFDLFVQADRPVDPGRGGIGLGLTLARRLVELHGGDIEAVSAGPGQGSEFIVRLPLIDSPATARQAPRRQPRAAAAPCRILIVDDNPDSAESMRLTYRVAGHDVHAVHEGAAAVDAAAEMKADAVLLDIGLPDIDGYEVARRLRADSRTRDALIIAITGYGRDEDRRRSEQAGIDHHVVKPVDPDEVLARIARGRDRGRNSQAPAQSHQSPRKDS